VCGSPPRGNPPHCQRVVVVRAGVWEDLHAQPKVSALGFFAVFNFAQPRLELRITI
jgi:hypothetical protein